MRCGLFFMGGIFMQDTFTLFEPVFYFILAMSLIMLVLAIIPKYRSRFYQLLFSISNLILIVLLFFTEGIIVEEFELKGDELTFSLGIIAVTLNILTVYFALRKKAA